MSDQQFIQRVRSASAEELDKMLMSAEFNDTGRLIILQELTKRAVDTQHWSVTPMFWVSVIAAVAACIAAYFSIYPQTQFEISSVLYPQAHTESSTSPQRLQSSPPGQQSEVRK